MNNFVINPLSKEQLADFLDDKAKDIIKYFIIKSLFSQPESKIGQKSLPIQIPKEHIEQWFTQALDVKPVGSGSYPVDIYNEREEWGADIKMLNITVDKHNNPTNKDSGEASLGQKFSDDEINLDTLFTSGNYEAIRDKWVLLYANKYKSLKKDYPSIKNIFYFFILRPNSNENNTDFYFTGAILNLNKINQVKVNKERTTKKSVFLDGFIKNDFGNTKIYKSKKRLELRLKSKVWIENKNFVKITTSFKSKSINLREKNIDLKHLEKEIKEIKNIKINFILE